MWKGTRTHRQLPPSLLLFPTTSIGKVCNSRYLPHLSFFCLSEFVLQDKIITMWHYYLAAGLILFWFFLLRPRGGGKNSPPLVTASTVVRIPLVGVIAEFLKNPNEMMKRCYNDYGQVFTIPVSGTGFIVRIPWVLVNPARDDRASKFPYLAPVPFIGL